MATATAAYADIRINDNARFRTQMGWFATQLETLGWAKTADTGQIDWATVSAPGGADTAMGYEIRTASGLYMKIEYGSGYGGAYSKGFWFTLGLGSDGAGAITTQLLARTQVRSYSGGAGGSARAGDDFAAGDTTRLMLAVTDDTNATYGCGIVLQKTHDAALNESSDGTWWLVSFGYNTTANLYAIGALSGTPTTAQAFGNIYFPRSVGDASNNPVSPAYAWSRLAGPVAMRDVMVATYSLFAHQATGVINGRTYLAAFGNTASTNMWGFTAAFNRSLLVRYD